MSLFDKGWIDLVFEGRNKKYGAYKLRSENPRTTIIAFICGAAFFSVAVAGPMIYDKIKALAEKDEKKDKPKEEITVMELPEEIPVDIEELPPPPPEVVAKEAPKSVVDEVKFKPLEAADEKEVVEPVITQEEFKDATPAAETSEGDQEFGDINIDVNAGALNRGVDPAPPNDDPVIYSALSVKPEFPGGIKKFYEYVNKNFRTPDLDRDTKLNITVSFVVEKDGSLTNIKVLKDPGYGAGKEAERVLKSLKTKWSPGEQNGKKVRATYILPISILIQAN